VAENDEGDPWDFLGTSKSKSSGDASVPESDSATGAQESELSQQGSPEATEDAQPATESVPAAGLSIADLMPVRKTAAATESVSSNDDAWGFLATRKADVAAREDSGAVPEARVEKREAGEFRAEMVGASLKRRAWPIAAALVVIFFAGFVTEVVAASEMIALAGTGSLLIIYPIGGLGLIVLGLLQFRLVDGSARLRVLRYASLIYAVLFAGALALITGGIIPIVATGLIWVLADQLNYLLPLLIWSLAGDEFNVAEGRKIFGWLVAWTYLGQVAGLLVALLTPALFSRLGVDLTVLLIIAPLVCLVVGVWLPRAMRGSSAAKGTAKREGYGESLKGAAEFINGVPIWRSLVAASTLTFIAGSTVIMGYSVGVGDIVGRDAATLQVIFAGVWLAALSTCWVIQHFFAERVADRWGVPGTLFILPIATISATIVLALGFGLQSIALLIAAILIWRLPRWSLDENARRGALALVPDERRTRVSFIVDLMPVAVGLVLSAPIVLVGVVTDRLWISAVIGTAFGLVGAVFSWKVVKGWDDSLTNWRLRRRKQNRSADLFG